MFPQPEHETRDLFHCAGQSESSLPKLLIASPRSTVFSPPERSSCTASLPSVIASEAWSSALQFAAWPRQAARAEIRYSPESAATAR